MAMEDEAFEIELWQIERMRVERMRESARLRIQENQDGERREIEQITTRPSKQQRGHEEDEQRSLRRPVETERPDSRGRGGAETDQHERESARRQLGARWAPISLAFAAAAAVLLRAPFFGLPLTSDEGGYAEVARLWQHGHSLYSDLFVDRPQGLLLFYRGLLALDLTSTVALRAAAAGVAAATVLVVAAIAARVGGRINGYATAVLLATLGASPLIESFTLSGELLAALPAALSLLAFTVFLRVGKLRWAAFAGLLCGTALMMKQSGFDTGLAAAAWLVLARRRQPRAGKALGLLVGGAAIPVVAGLLAAPSASAWFDAVIAYRGRGDSLLTGSLLHRLHLFLGTLPAAAAALGLLAVLAAYGWGRAHLLLRLWVIAAVVGVVGGGNFHPHYYVQLAPPLAAVGGAGIARLESGRVAVSALVGSTLIAVAAAASVALASTSEQVHLIWRDDPHLRWDRGVAASIRARVPHERPIAVLWGDAALYFLADRPPAVRYLWYRNAEALPGATQHDIHVLAERPVAVVVTLAGVERRYPPLRLIIGCAYRPLLVRGPLELFAPRPAAWRGGKLLPHCR